MCGPVLKKYLAQPPTRVMCPRGKWLRSPLLGAGRAISLWSSQLSRRTALDQAVASSAAAASCPVVRCY